MELINLFFAIAGLFFSIEIVHNLRPKSPLIIKPREWNKIIDQNTIKVHGWLDIYNPHPKMEVMVPKLNIEPKLLSKEFLGNLNQIVKITPHHPDLASRADNYWEAYIVKSRKSTAVYVEIIISKISSKDLEEHLESLWIDINWQNYGPFGKLNRKDGFVVPFSIPQETKNWVQLQNGFELLPIKTHILGVLDNPSEVINYYCSKLTRPGDIITIGESPLAVMQGRYISPSSINVSFLARLLCKFFHPTSSLATAFGMQSLIDLIGPSRTILAWIFGGVCKLFRLKGIFYILAGEQARLIDDITGTTPPYDQTIVLGPIHQKEFCINTAQELDTQVAIVDVNDLGKVKVLESSNKLIHKILSQALTTNPAGNANQHTPIVLIRPYKKLPN